MRLIDADELMALLRVRKNSSIGTDLEEIPTVKAISIEWIDKYENTEWEGDELVFTKMIRKWEKENDSDDTIRV